MTQYFWNTVRIQTVGIFAALLMLGAIAQAQDASGPVETTEPWQNVITSQIEAFRAKDAPSAFHYAGAGFQVAFPSAEAFFSAIVGAGYAPIVESRSHSFGQFQKMGDKAVVQEVKLVGN